MTEGLSRKERERLRHRREILEAGERVFARKGYHGATIEEIAREAEFAVGTIYNFFDGKDALYASIVQAMLESFFEAFEARVLTAASPAEAIGTLVELRIQLFVQHRGLFQAALGTLPAGHLDPVRALPKECAHFHERYIKAVGAVMERGRAAGLFCDEAPRFLVLVLDGIVNAFIVHWSKGMKGPLSANQVDDLKRLVFRALGCSVNGL